MNNRLPSVTVIIAARPDQAGIQAVPAARQLDYPPELLEIMVARGKQPSVQRNTALRAARWELVCFYDDDSVAPPGTLRQLAAHFADDRVQVVGGPNLCPPMAPGLEKVFSLVLASWLAFGPSRARYASVGAVRETSEKELILCNLIARRRTLLELGGFNEALYPNEENALMDDIQKRGGRLLYDPACFVYRRPRGTMKAFAKMLLTYGRGRAEQFRVRPTRGSLVNFVPPLFCVFLLALPWLGKAGLLVLGIYLLAVLGQVGVLMTYGSCWRGVAAMPFIMLTHVLYGLGFWRGLFTRLRTGGGSSSVPVQLEIIQP